MNGQSYEHDGGRSIATPDTNNFDNPLSFMLIFDCSSGAVAQLGERLNGIQEADGSIPFSSTIISFCSEHHPEFLHKDRIEYHPNKDTPLKE